MSGGRGRKLVVAALVGGLVAAIVRQLRGGPAPVFANHPSVDGGPRPAPEASSPGLTAPVATGDTGDDPLDAPVDELAQAVLRPVADVAADEPAMPVGPPGPGSPDPEDVTLALAGTAPAAGTPWVEPSDGTCPDGYPVKGKLKSGIFHIPGMLAYDRTRPDRCYATAEDAVADGLRPAKR